MKKNVRRNVVVNNVMPATNTTSGKTIKIEVDPVEIRKENANIEMKDCSVKVQPIKFSVKGDNIELPEKVSIGHAEISLEIGGLAMSGDAMCTLTESCQKIVKYIGDLFITDEKKCTADTCADQKQEEKPEEAEEKEEKDDFDPIKE